MPSAGAGSNERVRRTARDNAAPVRSFAGLTDHDLELLVADLFGAEEGLRYEAFARGPDLGVDVRHEEDDGRVHVVQCKHYLQTAVSGLRTEARKETRKLKRLDPQPASYRFVTTRRLTQGNKRDLKTDLAPYIERQRDIWGEHDLDQLLGRHPEVERRHIKLWLPSSTQLQTLLAAGTYSRSRALAEEIMSALPRWVPSQRFFEAREMLRDERVCVIAGVAGIGKTTLAKMLVADAIGDGYEPIAVSADVEEAWKVYDPGRRQVFYYDDFLGKTALIERLGKNEEDRLLAFMRRVAGSESTLFILTTRENILQQAAQLYEQLARDGVKERRVLLELEDYSRLDRARIFYNHAYFSEQLSSMARRALLKDQAYEAIIDHRAYNPRQIEWITGLSGHRLTDAENANYVTFALTALNDPTLIWRHGFEHQLDDVQRALLLALATMPDPVVHDDLQRAFDGFCGTAGISTRGRAFERALEVLDDSFVRAYHDAGRIFIEAYDPSVSDFLNGYLAASPSDARHAVRGAVYFEQVVAMSKVFKPADATEDYARDFVDAVERTRDAPSCSWHEVYYGRGATEPTTVRRRRSLEDRVAFMGRMKKWGGPLKNPDIRSRVRELYNDAKADLLSGWSEGRGESSDALRLLRAMRGRGEGVGQATASAKRLFVDDLHYTQAFGRLLELRAFSPGAFSEPEWTELQAIYVRVAEQELEDWTEMGDVDEVDDIAHYGQRMGVPIDPNELASTRAAVEERVAEAEERAYEEEEEDVPDSEDIDPDDEGREIERLFVRLASS